MEIEKNIVPKGKQILLEIKEQSVTRGGIVLPDSAKPEDRFYVVTLGKDVKAEVEPGDVVICNPKYTAKLPDVGANGKFALVHEDGIMATIEDKNTITTN